MRKSNQNNPVVAAQATHTTEQTQSKLDVLALMKLREGSEEAIDYIFNRYYNLLCNKAYQIVKNEDVAEDIVQELITNIWHKREQLNIQYSLKAYLLRSTKNRSLSYLRDHGNRMLPFDEHNTQGSYEMEDELYKGDLQVLVRKFINSLPTKCGEVYRLNKIDQLTYKEIAHALQISVKTVEHHIYKAKTLAKERLSPSILSSDMAEYYRFCR